MILALMIPAAALADIPIIPMDDPTPAVIPTLVPVPVVTPVPQPTTRPLPTYNPWQTDYVWPTATPAPVSRTLSEGMSGPDVLQVQQKLRELGYYQGALNSEYNNSLTYAVRLFQMDWNRYNPDQAALAVDGRVGPSTRKVLFGSGAEPTVTAPANTFTLEKGMKGEEVLTAQKRLAQLGYYLGELNGEFNDSMVYAVKLMQQKNEITVDGKIGYNTRLLMYSSSVLPADYPDYNIGTMSIGMTGENV